MGGLDWASRVLVSLVKDTDRTDRQQSHGTGIKTLIVKTNGGPYLQLNIDFSCVIRVVFKRKSVALKQIPVCVYAIERETLSPFVSASTSYQRIASICVVLEVCLQLPVMRVCTMLQPAMCILPRAISMVYQ
eukprot:jgi/Botrbrau1/23256/Bobra.0102s0001.1